MPVPRVILACAILVILGLIPAAVRAQEGAALYCLRCHSSAPALTLGALAWQGPVASEQEHPCPGVSRIKQELYLTQGLFFTANRVLRQNGLEGRGEAWLELMRLKARLRNLLNQPVWSLEQGVDGLRGLREELTRRILQPAWQMRAQSGKRRFWGLAALLFALLSGMALFMYFRHQGTMRRAVLPDSPKEETQRGPHDPSGQGTGDAL